MGTVLYVTAETVRQIAILIQPVMPDSAAKLLDLLGVADDKRNFAELGKGGRLSTTVALPVPRAVFPRYVDETD